MRQTGGRRVQDWGQNDWLLLVVRGPYQDHPKRCKEQTDLEQVESDEA